MTASIRTAIVGPTGYTGVYLIELLLRHPQAELTYLASHRDVLPDIREEFPRLLGKLSDDVAICKPIDVEAIAKAADVVFLALPHKAAMAYAPKLLNAGLKVIDLSADYRLASASLYETVYQTPHEDVAHLKEAVYGLPELFREQIQSARLIANPGCYPTAAALAITPLLKEKLAKPEGIIINAASGVTGAGRSAKAFTHFPELNESYYAYGAIGGHRHQPEIAQTLSRVAGEDVAPLFVPHLLPVDRGILETIYLQPADQATAEKVQAAFTDAYQDEPFIRLKKSPPNIKDTRDTNFVDLYAHWVESAGQPLIAVFVAEDNMMKGASSQAVQNMNLIFGLDETTGLL